MSNGLDEPNWFFFKIFFDFDTNYGLLGGQFNAREANNNYYNDKDRSVGLKVNNDKFGGINSFEITATAYKNTGQKVSGVNSARSYLENLINNNLYLPENITKRWYALNKFCQLLSNINTYTPWIFKGVGGLNDAAKLELSELTKEKTISLDLNVETVDWRITSLFSL